MEHESLAENPTLMCISDKVENILLPTNMSVSTPSCDLLYISHEGIDIDTKRSPSSA